MSLFSFVVEDNTLDQPEKLTISVEKIEDSFQVNNTLLVEGEEPQSFVIGELPTVETAIAIASQLITDIFNNKDEEDDEQSGDS